MSIEFVGSTLIPEGDGVTVRRLMPAARRRHFDPIVLWDHFDICNGGFPDHPHRGFEAITYLFDGVMNHADNLGNRGSIHCGGAQRFTAGRGIVHSEFPEGRAHGIQLWINLPKRLKGLPPAYEQAEADAIPAHEENGVRTSLIVGEGGAITLHTPTEYLMLDLHAGSRLQRRIPACVQGLIYSVEGGVTLAGHDLSPGEAALVSNEQDVELASENGARLMWCFSTPHHEPIYQHGPFVD